MESPWTTDRALHECKTAGAALLTPQLKALIAIFQPLRTLTPDEQDTRRSEQPSSRNLPNAGDRESIENEKLRGNLASKMHHFSVKPIIMPCVPEIAALAGAAVSVYVGNIHVGILPLTVIKCEHAEGGPVCYAFLTARVSDVLWRNPGIAQGNGVSVREYFHPSTLRLLRLSEGKDSPSTHILRLPCAESRTERCEPAM